MPGIHVKDKPAAFLRKSRKLKVPKRVGQSSWPSTDNFIPMIKTGSYPSCSHSPAPIPSGQARVGSMAERKDIGRGSWGMATQERKRAKKDQDGSPKLTPWGQRVLDGTGGSCQQEGENKRC
ncbi:40S ribosomal protein S19-like [Arvicola amphibius]|uniref:40S ribosomal protein S19-like n=1 Tax=Arvicola amphibius TaxID=1047088 RepID=UPI001C09A611|nr:40S ribosomal protein S19-like [Arvicola amphibius]